MGPPCSRLRPSGPHVPGFRPALAASELPAQPWEMRGPLREPLGEWPAQPFRCMLGAVAQAGQPGCAQIWQIWEKLTQLSIGLSL